MSETLSNLGTDKVTAEELVNVIGQMSPILSFSPKDGLMLTINNAGGGVSVALELRDSNGDYLPLDTELTMEYDAPRLDKSQVVAHTLSNIQQFRTLSVKEQQNEEYRGRCLIPLKGSAVDVRDIDTFSLSVESSAEIDWANSRVFIDQQNVRVGSSGE